MSRHGTPLRYPGGKQRLSPFILEILTENQLIGGDYAEPYAGGAGVAIELLISGKVSKIHLNDSSYPVYAFWKALVEHPEEMCRLVKKASLNVKEWDRQRQILKDPNSADLLDVGFSMLYLNRCNRSGVLNGGMIGGRDQSGEWKIDARFSRSELIRRIEIIAQHKRSIKLRNWDAEKFLQSYVSRLPEKTLVYLDPPYYHRSRRLYLDYYSPDDHSRLASTVQEQVGHHWVISYDNTDEIRSLYSARKHFTYDLQYNAARVYKGREVFFFSDTLRIPGKSSLPFIQKSLSQSTEYRQSPSATTTPP